LIGLDPLEEKPDKKFETNSETMDIRAYHESVLKYVVDDFLAKGFKYISVLPGGFKECHDVAQLYQFQIHQKEAPCYHCDKHSNKTS
jgi:hypothetical protein